MGNIDYSVVIRTTGKAGEKYQALLNSIEELDPAPKEVIVVLPEGNELPNERLGTEVFHFSKKGMVIQRLEGIKRCKTKYALVCDDDVCFKQNFVKKLYKPIEDKKAYFSAGPLYSFLPPKGFNAVLCNVMASAMPTFFHKKDRYVTVLKSSGYSYNRHLDLKKREYYETQSAAWTCFFADLDVFRAIDFEDEMWLDTHNYSALDDQTMFYKAWLRGYKTAIVVDAEYEHLDARTSTRNNKPAALYSGTFNRVVFWHRFIYSMQNNKFSKLISKIAFIYRMVWMRVWDRVSVFRHRMSLDDYQIAKSGYKEGWKYLTSQEYKSMPKVI